MLERLHEHILSELGQSSRTDTIFVVVAVLFNLIVLGINSVAAASNNGLAALVILGVFILMTVLVNVLALAGLYVGRQTRARLLAGLVAIYTDHEVVKYYDKSLISNYGMRYLLFGAVLIVLALTAIVVPLAIRLL